jgi:hypothetical protein
VKPSSRETRTWTADVTPWPTTEPSGECTTFGVVNSRVSASTILPGTMKSQRGELDFSRTLTGIASAIPEVVMESTVRVRPSEQ